MIISFYYFVICLEPILNFTGATVKGGKKLERHLTTTALVGEVFKWVKLYEV